MPAAKWHASSRSPSRAGPEGVHGPAVLQDADAPLEGPPRQLVVRRADAAQAEGEHAIQRRVLAIGPRVRRAARGRRGIDVDRGVDLAAPPPTGRARGSGNAREDRRARARSSASRPYFCDRRMNSGKIGLNPRQRVRRVADQPPRLQGVGRVEVIAAVGFLAQQRPRTRTRRGSSGRHPGAGTPRRRCSGSRAGSADRPPDPP